tara:strand:- start:573 stop:968 length:396 start_codon:yes stop_codon:yes gene_type:complete
MKMGKGISLEELKSKNRPKKAVQPMRRAPQPAAWNSIRELGELLNQFEREHFRPREQKQAPRSQPEEGVVSQVFYAVCLFLLMNLIFVVGLFVSIYQIALILFNYEISYFGYAPLVWAGCFNAGLVLWLEL